MSNAIYSGPDAVTGVVIRYNEWSTFTNAYGIAETVYAINIADMDLPANELHHLAAYKIKAYLLSRDECGIQYELQTDYSIEYIDNNGISVMVLKAWEV